jgi:flagellar motor switch protein FliM
MALLVPWISIDPVAAAVAGRDPLSANDDADARMARALTLAPVNLRAEVAAADLPVGEILGLTPGTVIRLGGKANDGVALFAENVKLCRARPGTSGSRRAVQILGPEDGE